MPRLLRPGWLVLHVLAVGAALATGWLGWWQWERGVATGSIRNYSYGLEWWGFALLGVVGYVKLCVDERHGAVDDGVLHGAVVGPASTSLALAVAEEDDDPEVAAWNARFRELAAADAAKQASQLGAAGPARLTARPSSSAPPA